MNYDMHSHTNHSDGELTPEKLIIKALEKNLTGVSITDHDTLSGVSVANEYILKNNIDIELIPGIEFGTTWNEDEIHILGYFIDINNEDLCNALKELNLWRKERSYLIIKELRKLNIDISEDYIQTKNSDFIGRVDIAKELVRINAAKDIPDAFQRYLSIGKSCYVPKKTHSVKTIISLIKNAGGVAILAHPILLKDFHSLNHVITEGIDGIECIHSKHTISDSITFLNLADSLNLLVSGGSDCHGRLENGNKEIMLGNYYINETELNKIRRLADERK